MVFAKKWDSRFHSKQNLDSNNVLVNEANKYLEDGKTPVSWNFSTMPSEEWKNGVGSALTAYAADQTDANWAKVVSAFCRRLGN